MPAGSDLLASVVIPVRDAVEYLDEALTSIRGQSASEIEIIVVDDGSTDGSGAIAERHAAEDDRVRVVRQTAAGASGARNRGISEARASWIALMDADDVALPRRLERQLAFLAKKPGIAALGTYGWRMGERGETLGVFDVGPRDEGHLARLRAANEPIYLLSSSVMVDAGVVRQIGGFRDLAPAEDVDLWTRIADDHLVLAMPERLVRYRVRSGSMSGRHFVLQQQMTVLVAENAARRRSGLPEVTLADVIQRLDHEPALARAKRILSWHSQYCYRVAGGRLANRDPSGVPWLAAAFILSPGVPIGRLRRQLLPWFGSRLRGARATAPDQT